MDNILNANDEERKEAEEWYYEVENRQNYQEIEKRDKALELAKKLGLGGVWRGYFLAVKTIYDYL